MKRTAKRRRESADNLLLDGKDTNDVGERLHTGTDEEIEI